MSSSFISNPFYALSKKKQKTHTQTILSFHSHFAIWSSFFCVFIWGRVRDAAMAVAVFAVNICIIACLNHLLWQMGIYIQTCICVVDVEEGINIQNIWIRDNNNNNKTKEIIKESTEMVLFLATVRNINIISLNI